MRTECTELHIGLSRRAEWLPECRPAYGAPSLSFPKRLYGYLSNNKQSILFIARQHPLYLPVVFHSNPQVIPFFPPLFSHPFLHNYCVGFAIGPHLELNPVAHSQYWFNHLCIMNFPGLARQTRKMGSPYIDTPVLRLFRSSFDVVVGTGLSLSVSSETKRQAWTTDRFWGLS